MKFFSLTFYFSICMSCLFPGHPVIFTSCHLYFPQVIEYLFLLIWQYEVIIFFKPTFTIVLANHSNAYKINCILFPDCQSYFHFLHPLWVFLNWQHIRIHTQIRSTQPKQPKFSIHNTEKKVTETTKQRKQLMLTNGKNILNVFNQCKNILNVFNQYNACNLILQLMV